MLRLPNVRLWHKADVLDGGARRPLPTQSGHRSPAISNRDVHVSPGSDFHRHRAHELSFLKASQLKSALDLAQGLLRPEVQYLSLPGLASADELMQVIRGEDVRK